MGGSVRLPAGTPPEGGKGPGAKARGGLRGEGRESCSVRASWALPAVHLGQNLLHRGARKSLRFGGHWHRCHLEGSQALAGGSWQGRGHLLARGWTQLLHSCGWRGRVPLPIGGLR